MRARTRLILEGGLWSGLLGYGTVVVFFALLNAATGRSVFYTAAALGSRLFYHSSVVRLEPGPVLAYNMAHMLVFLALGLLSSWLFVEAEEHPVARYGLLVALLVVAAHIYAALVILAEPVLGGGAYVPIAVASILAAGVMAWYLFRAHPALRAALKEIPLGAE